MQEGISINNNFDDNIQERKHKHMKITQRASPNRSAGRQGHTPDFIVCHTTGGSFTSAINTIMNAANQVSYHFVISRTGEVVQAVRLEDTAWANGTRNDGGTLCNSRSTVAAVRERRVNANLYTVSIGFADMPDGVPSEAQMVAAVELIRHIRTEVQRIYRIVIPFARSNIIGHGEIAPVTRSGCPGRAFPFDELVRRLNVGANGATTPGLSITPEELDILHRIVWAEARGEDDHGQQLVASVVMNRVQSPEFPDTVRDVVFQPGQFTPITNGAFDRATPDQRNRDAVRRALYNPDISQGALFFRTVRGAEGSWHEQALQPLFDHGVHRFYTTREATQVTPPCADFAVGDIVQFTGGGVFRSSTDALPASNRGASLCKVTQASPGARNPLHLISEDGGGVWGWVERENVK